MPFIEFSTRKKEISSITSEINSIENDFGKNLLCTITFPRIYSHYEKYILESVIFLIKSILDKNPNLENLRPKLYYFLLGLHFQEKSAKKVIELTGKFKNNISNLDIKSLEGILTNKYELHKNIVDFIQIFEMNYHSKYTELSGLCTSIIPKYSLRCSIAHGDKEISEIVYKDWLELRNIILRIFDLIEEIFNDYIEKEKFLLE